MGVMAVLRKKRLLIVSVLMAALAAGFWSGSRYPALNEKAEMGTETPLSGLGFSSLLEVDPDQDFATRVLVTTANWVYTNRQGMTFGVLFGAVLMTLIGLLDRRSFRSRFANSVLGMLIGTPLGVCVNCAAPIAKGMYSGGARSETMLATMVSSPTLNVVVLTMLFALFPPHIAILKVGLTLGVILIFIPLLTRFLHAHDTPGINDSSSAVPGAHDVTCDSAPAGSIESWHQAARWTVSNLARSLWSVIRTTVPLMLLAGLLGSALITVLPLDSLSNVVPAAGRQRILAAMTGVALLGVFLPVPMSFDVILTAVLWKAGLPIRYAMILLFTLGVFSIFPFFIVWKSIGRRVATSLFLGLAGLGVFAGLMGHQLFAWDFERQQRSVLEVLGGPVTSLRGPTILRFGNQTSDRGGDERVVSAVQRAALTPATWLQDRGGVSVASIPFSAAIGGGAVNGAPGRLFTRLEGRQSGIDEPYSFSVLGFEGPLVQFRGIASGDVHNDGWTDVLLTSEFGLSLYANRQGRGFDRQDIDIQKLRTMRTVNAALVDLDNDGWLDIALSTYQQGTHLIYNEHGRFTERNMRRLPDQPGALMTGAVAFGDVDKDGNLDIVQGSWAQPLNGVREGSVSNKVMYLNRNGGFRQQSLPEVPDPFLSRQTLSILLSDINSDGNLDLIVGNEDFAPDDYYFGNGDGTFRTVLKQQGIIPRSTSSTMSVTSADLDNDLRPEIYLGQISRIHRDDNLSARTGPELCDELSQPDYRANCQKIMRVHRDLPKATSRNETALDALRCRSIEERDFREDCIAYSLLLWARKSEPEQSCDLFPAPWETFGFLCHRSHDGSNSVTNTSRRKAIRVSANAIPAYAGDNVLLMPTDKDHFSDRATEMGLPIAGFTWNAKFADLDNDEFVDLYAVNGWLPDRDQQRKFFFHNENGSRFVDETSQAGLISHLATSSYTYADVENDGDLDIVSAPIAGPILVYINHSERNRIAFELRDHIGNRTGVGSKIVIHYGPGGARHQMREIQASGGFISFDAPIAYFGVGNVQTIERVEVRWSTGERSELHGDFPAGARYILTRSLDGKTQMHERKFQR